MWTVPPDLESALKTSQQAIPAPVHGLFLLDTGATTTCISEKSASALNLKPTRVERSFGADGEMQSPIYLANLVIPIQTPAGERVDLNWGGEMRGVKELEKPMGIINFAGRPSEVIGLLGRDVLRFTRFTYDGISGHFAIEFDLSSMRSVMGIPQPVPSSASAKTTH